MRWNDEDHRPNRAEIERLLVHYAGKVGYGSALAGQADPGARRHAPLGSLLADGAVVEGAGSGVLVVRHGVPATAAACPEDHPRGYILKAPWLSGPDCVSCLADLVTLLSGCEFSRPLPAARLAFIDTETTGMMAATGTHAFLVGIGWFEPATAPGEVPRFVVEQYFMEDYCHEPAMLEAVMARLGQFDGIVSYNGLTFDVPVLRARFIMNRMRSSLDMPHLDLLHPARRLWRNAIGSCSLRQIEHLVLGLRRRHDVDSALIPRIYLDYIHHGRTAPLVPVFDHHAQDIVSLGALLCLLCECAADPAHPANRANGTALGWGKLLKTRGAHDGAAAFLESAVHSARTATDANTALAELAAVYTRMGRPGDAAEIWQAEVNRAGIRNPTAITELAKLLEWKMGDPAAALAVVENALGQMATARALGQWTGARGMDEESAASMERRRVRLARKAARQLADPKAPPTG